ncbi:MAG: efflux RND transporter permease subunit, partial [bacterium]|nr:efflux RND transporter permease subunit [bacterium]
VRDVTRDDKDGKEQVEILFDYAALARMGMTVIDAAQTIRVAYDGEVVTRVQYDEEETEFRVMLPAYSRKNLSYLKDLSIPNAENRLIKLKHVAKFKNTSGPSNFIHFDNERTINVQANVDENIILPEDASALVLNNFNLAKDYPGLRFKEEGAAKKKKESLATSSRTFAIAVLAIYFLMVILFNSLSQPLMVLSAVPFGFIGVIFTFAVHNEPLSFMAMLGIIGLSGVVVNDSLVLVDHLNKEIKENNNKSGSHKESLFSVIARGTADRLRPILMTTITTAAGLIPLAYGIGGTDPTNAPMALALGWGLVLATPLTLMLLPCLYVILDDVRKKVREFVKV